MSTAIAYKTGHWASLDTVEKTLPKSAKLDWQNARDLHDYNKRLEIANHLCANDLWSGCRRRRYMACGQSFLYKSTECDTEVQIRQFCHLYRVCPTCARIRSYRQKNEIAALVTSVEKKSENRLYDTKSAILAVLSRLEALSKLAGQEEPKHGQIGVFKATLGAELDDIIDQIRALEAIRSGWVLKSLKKAKAGLRAGGFNRASWAQYLRWAQRRLADQIDFRWRFITVTIRTNGRFWWAARQISAAFPRVYRKLFKAPGTAAHRCTEFGSKTGNVHIHALYYGPYIPQRLLSKIWLEETGSFVCDIRAVDQSERGLNDAVAEVTKYMTKIAAVAPDKLVEFEKALYKRHISQRYGLFRELNSSKVKPDRVPAIAARLPRYRGDKSGGLRVEFERPIKCTCGCGSHMELSAQQPVADDTYLSRQVPANAIEGQTSDSSRRGPALCFKPPPALGGIGGADKPPGGGALLLRNARISER